MLLIGAATRLTVGPCSTGLIPASFWRLLGQIALIALSVGRKAKPETAMARDFAILLRPRHAGVCADGRARHQRVRLDLVARGFGCVLPGSGVETRCLPICDVLAARVGLAAAQEAILTASPLQDRRRPQAALPGDVYRWLSNRRLVVVRPP